MLEKKSVKKEHYFYNLFLQSTFVCMISISFGCSLYYVESCRGHFFSGVLPICQKVDGKWGHKDWPSPSYKIGFCILQFLITTDFICAVFLNFGAIYFIIFGSQQISKEMRYLFRKVGNYLGFRSNSYKKPVKKNSYNKTRIKKLA
jgi:hypothetical protein